MDKSLQFIEYRKQYEEFFYNVNSKIINGTNDKMT